MQNEKIKTSIPAWVALESDVLVCKKLSSTEKVLYAIIAALCNNDNKECFATNGYFSKILNITSREVQYCLKKLVKLEFIEVKIQHNKRTITTGINSFLKYREEQLKRKHQDFLDFCDYDWLNDNNV